MPYEHPNVTDYGTLVELTEALGEINSDVPNGPDNTAFPPGPS